MVGTSGGLIFQLGMPDANSTSGVAGSSSTSSPAVRNNSLNIAILPVRHIGPVSSNSLKPSRFSFESNFRISTTAIFGRQF